jgi:hypothetical protein
MRGGIRDIISPQTLLSELFGVDFWPDYQQALKDMKQGKRTEKNRLHLPYRPAVNTALMGVFLSLS